MPGQIKFFPHVAFDKCCCHPVMVKVTLKNNSSGSRDAAHSFGSRGVQQETADTGHLGQLPLQRGEDRVDQSAHHSGESSSSASETCKCVEL